MKKLAALLLCVVTVFTAFTSCGFDPDDKGAIIPAYLASQVPNIDPTRLIYDKDTVKYSSLLFEGLTVVNADGSVSGGLAKSWHTEFDDDRQEYFVYFDLHESHWSDGRSLLADHFVYAWKRILSPGSDSPAASLLFDIKNARQVKSGEMTVDDLGVAAISSYTLEIQLEKKMDLELFLEALASPALVPLRDDVLTDNPEDWAASTENLVSCGYFNMFDMGSDVYDLSKASNYRLSYDVDAKENPNTYVKPQKLYSDYSTSNIGRWNAYFADELYYMEVTEVPEGAEDSISDIKTEDLLCTYTCYFDNENKLLQNKNVRQALSLALDREKVASLTGLGASAATGFVAQGVFDATKNSSFRKTGGDLISVAADEGAAKGLLQNIDLNQTLTLTYQKEEEAVAKYLKETWENLGFKIKLNGLDAKTYQNVLNAQKFDMLLLDYQALSTTAYSFLMPFAVAYSGNRVEVDGDFTTPHMTGFQNSDYDALADRVAAATTRAERTQLLHEMEQLFLDEMPAIPLCFWSTQYLTSSELTGLSFNGFGVCTFKDASLKNYAAKNEAWLAKDANK